MSARGIGHLDYILLRKQVDDEEWERQVAFLARQDPSAQGYWMYIQDLYLETADGIRVKYTWRALWANQYLPGGWTVLAVCRHDETSETMAWEQSYGVETAEEGPIPEEVWAWLDLQQSMKNGNY